MNTCSILSGLGALHLIIGVFFRTLQLIFLIRKQRLCLWGRVSFPSTNPKKFRVRCRLSSRLDPVAQSTPRIFLCRSLTRIYPVLQWLSRPYPAKFHTCLVSAGLSCVLPPPQTFLSMDFAIPNCNRDAYHIRPRLLFHLSTPVFANTSAFLVWSSSSPSTDRESPST